MQKNSHQTDNKIVVRHIEGNYFIFSREDFYIICKFDLGYFNISKLCSSNNRKIKSWYRNSKSKLFMKKYNIVNVKIGSEAILGHYCHPDLFINIASWISPDVYFKCCDIITKFLELKYRANLERYYTSIINHRIYNTNNILTSIQKQLSEKKVYDDPREVINNL